MQPNNYLQPNTYYQAQPAPAPLSPQPVQPKSSKKHIAIIVVLAILAVGLGLYILIDKLILSHQEPEISVSLSDTLASVPLSNIEIQDGAGTDILKQVLAGRTFVTNEIADEYLTFKSEDEYTYSYYRNPTDKIDHHQNPPSEHNGTYTVEDKTIKLSSGDVFKISNDYLIKTTDKVSANKNAIYFDINQIPTFKKNLTNAFLTFLSDRQKRANTGLPMIQRPEITSYQCTYDRPHMTNADSYICETSYNLYFNAKDVEKATATQPFSQYCPTLTQLFDLTNFTTACESPEPNFGYLSAWSNLIIRLKSANTYEITGSYHNDDETAQIIEESTDSQTTPAQQDTTTPSTN